MLRQKYRLTKGKDFHQIHVAGKSFFSSCCRIKLAKNNLAVSRFAVVVSAKISKQAVKRNRLKRQLREIIRLNLDRLATGVDVIVSPNRQALDYSYQELQQQLLKLFIKAKLL